MSKSTVDVCVYQTTFEVPGLPIPKQSTRVVVNGRGKPHGVTPPRMKAWQKKVAWYASRAFTHDMITTGALTVGIIFYLPDKRRRDLDNLSKGTLDGMRGIVFKDDSQITELHLRKVLSNDPCAVIEIRVVML